MARSTTSGSKNSIKQREPEQKDVIADDASDTSHETADNALYSHEGSDGSSHCGRKRWVIGGILVLILLGIAIALGITLHEEKQEQQHTETSSKNLRGSATPDLDDTTQGNTDADLSTGDNFSEFPERPLQPGKTEWPELTGMEIDAAKNIIQQERPDLTVIVVRVGDFVTFDYDTRRVWLWKSEEGLVDRMPRVG